ncbi:MAG: SDR family NAD(P)-dependent oxidoreductase [Bacteroidales bacterium]
MQGLSGKNVLITGGTSGIGQAIAVRFAGEGANIAVNYRKTPEDAKDTEEKVQEDTSAHTPGPCRNSR